MIDRLTNRAEGTWPPKVTGARGAGCWSSILCDQPDTATGTSFPRGSAAASCPLSSADASKFTLLAGISHDSHFTMITRTLYPHQSESAHPCFRSA